MKNLFNSKDHLFFYQMSFTTVTIGIYEFLFGKGTVMLLLLFLMGLDFLTGTLASGIRRGTDSSVAWKGIKKKFAMLCIVAVSHRMDLWLFETNDFLRKMIVIFLISMEGLSLLENCGKLGAPYPEWFKNIFVQLQTEDPKTIKEENSIDSKV